MKRKTIAVFAVCACIMSVIAGCGTEKVKIESRTEENITVNQNITYNPAEETNEAVENEISDDVDTMHAGTDSDDNGSKETGSMFKFGVETADDEDGGGIADLEDEGSTAEVATEDNAG